MISNADTDCDPDSDPDIEDSSRLTAKFRVIYNSPERQSLSGSHGQRPWFQVGMTAVERSRITAGVRSLQTLEKREHTTKGAINRLPPIYGPRFLTDV